MTIRVDIAVLRARFDATRRAYREIRSTRDMHVLFAALDRAVADIERRIPPAEPAWLAAATGTRAPLPTPEPVDAAHVKCPRCLRRDADRADVEAKGVCLDCSLVAPQEPAPVAPTAHLRAADDATAPGTTSPASPDASTIEAGASPAQGQPVVARVGCAGGSADGRDGT